MKNKEIIENIKSKLTGNKTIDVEYLHSELKKYQALNNFDVAFEIQILLFNYLSKEEKEKLNQDANNMLKEHKIKYDQAIEYLNYGDVEKAKKILQELFDVYERVAKIKGTNFYDFSEVIEYFLYFGDIEKLKLAKIKKVPEPVVHYAYQIASIYLEQDDILNAINYLERALLFNPVCEYVLEELINRLIISNKYDEAFEYIKRSLKYAYTKKQLASGYKSLGIYFKHKKVYDKAIASFAVSNLYIDDISNKISIKEIVDVVGQIKFKDADHIISLFKEEGINYGPSKEVITTFKNFIEYAKINNDKKTLKYVLEIASKLTDDNYFLEQLNKLQ